MKLIEKLPSRGEKATWKPLFSMDVNYKMDSEQLTMARQLGVEAVYTLVPDELSNYESLKEIKARVEDAGLWLYRVANRRMIKNEALHLGTAQRDEQITKYCKFIEALGRLDVVCTAVSWQATPIWDKMYKTGLSESRGCTTREFDKEKVKNIPNLFDREYASSEIWDNYQYFLDKVLPVAEDAEVALAMHPNDPPLDVQGGIPSLIKSGDDYRRILSISNSPSLGVLMCIGCWLEGGLSFGDPVADTLEFVKTGRVYDYHFRNVQGELPCFTESFLDNGSTDMYPIMKALCESGYRGAIELDHTPEFFNDPKQKTANAYAIGYMRALAQRAANSYR